MLCNVFQMETEMEKMQSRLESSLTHSVTLQDRVRPLCCGVSHLAPVDQSISQLQIYVTPYVESESEALCGND